MKTTQQTLRFLASIFLILILTSCARRAKEFYADDGELLDYQQASTYRNTPDNDVYEYNERDFGGERTEKDTSRRYPLPPQRKNFNPQKDVNYSYFKKETVYFGFDNSTIPRPQRAKLKKIAKYLKSNPSKIMIIGGHTDARGTLEYNRALGERRALSARQYLIDLGIRANRISTISYGEDDPAVPGNSQSAYKKNRRAEFGIEKE